MTMGMTDWLRSFLRTDTRRDPPKGLDLCELDCRLDECKLDDPKQCRRRIAYFEQLSRITNGPDGSTP